VTRCAWLILINVGIQFCVGSAALAQHSTHTSNKYAYVFDCSGRFFRVDLSVGTRTEPADIPGWVRGRRIPVCSVESIAVDSTESVVYVAMPTVSRDNLLGDGHDQIVALRPPGMNILNSLDLPYATNQLPLLRQLVPAHELLITYDTPSDKSDSLGAAVEFSMSTDRPEQLVFKNQLDGQVTPRVLSQPALSETAYLEASGRVVDRDRVGYMNGSMSTVNGRSLLNDSMRQQFQSLQRTGIGGDRYLDVTFADSAAGKMLFLVGWDFKGNRSAAGAFFVYDALEERVISSAVTPYREAAYELVSGTPTIHLSPDGRTVVVEEYRWGATDRSSEQSVETRFKTGRIAVYNAATGGLLHTLDLSPVPGTSGRVLGFSLDGNIMYYASRDHMYVVDLAGDQTKSFPLPPQFSPMKVVTLDR
jgi:hypothetical protein